MVRIIIATLLAAVPSIALAQSSTASGTTKPMTPAPASGNTQQKNGQPKPVIPPAARSGDGGLHVGEGAMDAGPVEIRRNK